MADLSKIKLNGTEYNLKDTEARQAIPTKINNQYIGYLLQDILYIPKNWGFTQYQSTYSYYVPFYLKSSNTIISSASKVREMDSNINLFSFGTIVFNNQHINGNISLSADNLYIYHYSDGMSFINTIANILDISSAIGNINSFEVTIVTTLPTENIDTHTIYFMANNNNAYDEYMYINNNWELIGSSNIDLSSYLQTTDIADWAKAATKPTYTAAEVGALPDTTVIPDVTGKVNKSGDTMTGDLEFASQKNIILTNTNADSHKQITIKVSTRQVQGERTGCLEVNGSVVSSSVPLFSSDLTNKQYVDDKTAVTNTLSTGTRIATINGTDILAPEGGSSISEETDPVYSASPAASITTEKITAWDAKSDFSGSYNDLSDKPTIPTVPTNVSAFTNDSGYLTSFTETDPTVPAWAKAETKPAYTAAEVGAMATTHAANAITSTDISNWNSKTSNTGTVTSVRVQATSPVQSSTNTAQTTTLNTTISLADGYGDTKNPYGTKTANYVLAGPASGNAAVPGFRKLVAADIPAIGNITNAGDITTTATIASGDRLIINDESASKVTNSSITFGSSTTQYLANNGTWQNAYDDTALAARVTALENLEWATYYSGRSNPSNSQGQNGDIYLQY